METKVCPSCSKELPISSFKERTKRGVKQLRSSCIECEKKKNKEYYLSRKEELKRMAREYYYGNKDKVLADVKEYREKNRELLRKKDREYYRNHYQIRLVGAARARARKTQIEFDLQPEDIEIPAVCPLLEIPLEAGDGGTHAGSPSLDRIDPNKGYTKDNVWVISYKANTMKSNATLDELSLLVKNFRKELKRRG